MTRAVEIAPGEIYHLYNRGTEKRKIFSSKTDYERFMALLYLSNDVENVHMSNLQGSTLIQVVERERKKKLVDIFAYCLMPNHFHILAREIDAGGIARFMQK